MVSVPESWDGDGGVLPLFEKPEFRLLAVLPLPAPVYSQFESFSW